MQTHTHTLTHIEESLMIEIKLEICKQRIRADESDGGLNGMPYQTFEELRAKHSTNYTVIDRLPVSLFSGDSELCMRFSSTSHHLSNLIVANSLVFALIVSVRVCAIESKYLIFKRWSAPS